MSLSLGTLEIGLGLNTAQYDSGIKSAKDQLSSLERRVTKLGTTPLKIKISVDDRQLYGLNSHLLLKRVDLKKTVDFYKANPIKVFAEDDALVSLNQELRELKKLSVEIRTPSKIVVEHRFSGYQDRVEKAIERLSVTVRNSAPPKKNIFEKAFNLTVGNAVSGFFTGAGLYGGLKAGKGINKGIGIDFEEIGNEFGSYTKQKVKQVEKILDAGFSNLLGFTGGIKEANHLFKKNFNTLFDNITDPSFYKDLEDFVVAALQSKLDPSIFKEGAKLTDSQLADKRIFIESREKLVSRFEEVIKEDFVRAASAIINAISHPLRIRKRVQLRDSSEMVRNQSSIFAGEYEANKARIQDAEHIVLMAGGVDPTQSKPGQPNVDTTYRMAAGIQALFPKAFVDAVTPYHTTSLEDLEQGAYNQILRGSILPFIKEQKESLANIFGEKMVNNLIANLGQFHPIESILRQSVEKGYNDDSIRMATKALASSMLFPDKKITLAGASGGGFIVEEAIAILNQVAKRFPELQDAVRKVKGFGIGTPMANITATSGGSEGEFAKFQAYIGTLDKVGKGFFGENLYSEDKKAQDVRTLELDQEIALPSGILNPKNELQSVIGGWGYKHEVGLMLADLGHPVSEFLLLLSSFLGDQKMRPTEAKKLMSVFNQLKNLSIKDDVNIYISEISSIVKEISSINKKIGGVINTKDIGTVLAKVRQLAKTSTLEDIKAFEGQVKNTIQNILKSSLGIDNVPGLGTRSGSGKGSLLTNRINDLIRDLFNEVAKKTGNPSVFPDTGFDALDPNIQSIAVIEDALKKSAEDLNLPVGDFGSLIQLWKRGKVEVPPVRGFDKEFQSVYQEFLKELLVLDQMGSHYFENVEGTTKVDFNNFLWDAAQIATLYEQPPYQDMLGKYRAQSYNTPKEKQMEKALLAFFALYEKDAEIFKREYLQKVLDAKKLYESGDPSGLTQLTKILTTSKFSRIYDLTKNIDTAKKKIVSTDKILGTSTNYERLNSFFDKVLDALIKFEASNRQDASGFDELSQSGFGINAILDFVNLAATQGKKYSRLPDSLKSSQIADALKDDVNAYKFTFKNQKIKEKLDEIYSSLEIPLEKKTAEIVESYINDFAQLIDQIEVKIQLGKSSKISNGTSPDKSAKIPDNPLPSFFQEKVKDLAVTAKSRLEDVLVSRLGTPDKSGEIQHLSGNEDFAELLQLTLVKELKTAGLLLSKAFRDTSLDVVKFGQVVYSVMQALERPVMALPGAAMGKKAIQVGGTAAMGAAAIHALPMGLDTAVVESMRTILSEALSAGGTQMLHAVQAQMTSVFSGLPFGIGQQLTTAVMQLVTELTNGTINVLASGGAIAGSSLAAGEGVKKLLGAATSNIPKLVSTEEQQRIEGKTQKALKVAKNKADSLITTEITPYFDEKVFPVSNPIPANIKAINPEYYTVKQLRGLARDQGINVPASGAGAKKEEIWKSLTERFNPDQLTRLLLTTKASDRTKLGKKELSGFQIPTTEIPADFTKRIGIGIKNIGQEINATKDIQSLERLYFQLEKVKKGITALRANPEFNTTGINKSLSGFLQSVDNLQTQILAKSGLESGKDYQQGLKLGLSGDSAQKIAHQNALKIVDETNKGLGNASPSKKGKKSGEDYIKGVEIGVKEQSKNLLKTVQSTVTQVLAIAGALSAVALPALSAETIKTDAFRGVVMNPATTGVEVVKGYDIDNKAFKDKKASVYTSGPMFDRFVAKAGQPVNMIADVIQKGKVLQYSPNRAAAEERSFLGITKEGKLEFGYGGLKTNDPKKYDTFIGGLHTLYNDEIPAPANYKGGYAYGLKQQLAYNAPRPRVFFGKTKQGQLATMMNEYDMTPAQLEKYARQMGFSAVMLPDHGNMARLTIPNQSKSRILPKSLGGTGKSTPYQLKFSPRPSLDSSKQQSQQTVDQVNVSQPKTKIIRPKNIKPLVNKTNNNVALAVSRINSVNTNFITDVQGFLNEYGIILFSLFGVSVSIAGASSVLKKNKNKFNQLKKTKTKADQDYIDVQSQAIKEPQKIIKPIKTSNKKAKEIYTETVNQKLLPPTINLGSIPDPWNYTEKSLKKEISDYIDVYAETIDELSKKEAERTRKHKALKEPGLSTAEIEKMLFDEVEISTTQKAPDKLLEEKLPLYTPSSVVEKEVKALKEPGLSTAEIEKMLAESARKSEELFLKQMAKRSAKKAEKIYTETIKEFEQKALPPAINLGSIPDPWTEASTGGAGGQPPKPPINRPIASPDPEPEPNKQVKSASEMAREYLEDIKKARQLLEKQQQIPLQRKKLLSKALPKQSTREDILDDWNKKREFLFNTLDNIEKGGISGEFAENFTHGLKAAIANFDGFINLLSTGGKALRTLDAELNAATGGMINLRNGAMAVIGGFALFKGAEFLLQPLFFAIDDIPFRIQQAVTDSLLSFTELQRIKLNLNLAGVGNVEQSLDALVARADRLGISFKESAIAYGRFKLITTGSPLQAQADNIFEGFQEALAARQTNAQQQAESFRAIGQIASKSVVSVEEFTQQLSESGGLNDALNVAARSIGLTTAQFYQQASAGNLLVQDVLPRLAAEYKRMSAGGLSLSTETLQSEISRFQNNTEQLQMQLGEKIGVVAYPALQTLNAVLSTLNDNLGAVVSVGAAGLLSVMGFLGKSVMQFAAAGRLGAVVSAAMGASLQAAGVASLSTATAMGRLKVSINLATLAGIGLIKALIIPTAVIAGIQFVYSALNAGSEELKQAVRTLEESKKALDAWQNKTDSNSRKGLTSFLPDMELSGAEKFFNVITLGTVYNSKWLMSLLELRQGLENIDKSLATGVGNLKEYQDTLSNFSGSKQFSSELQEIRNNLALVRAERTIASAKGNDRSVAEFNQREQDLMKQEQELIDKQLGPVGSRVTADLQQYDMALASLEQSFKNRDITDIAYAQRKKDLVTIIGYLKKAEQDYLQVLKDQEKEYRKLQVAFNLAIRARANANFANEGNSLSRSIGLNQQFASGKINEFQFNVKVQEESLQTAKERIATLENSANSISNTLNERLSKSANKVLSTYFKEDLEQLNVASFGEAIAENLLSPDAIQQIMDQYESDLKDNAALKDILNQAKEYATARRDILNTEKEIQQISREIIVERKKRQIQEKQASGEIVKAEQLTNLANKTSSSQNINYGLEQTKINLAALYNQLAIEQEKLVLNVDDPLTVKTAIANITQQIAETGLSLRDQQEQIQDYYRNLDRQIIDFNRQIEDYRRQIEDAQLSAFKENRSLSESYSDLVRELDKNLLNAQNQLLDTTDRIRVQQVKNRLLIPGASDAGKELGDIFLEFVQGQADLASRGRTFQSRTEEIETSYISTLRNIRNLQEQQQEAERNRLRTIEDIKRTQENLNRTLADLIRQTNKELGFIPQSIKDIVTNLNTLPEPIKLINSELVAIPPNIKTSGEDLVKSIEETAEAIRKAKEGLILPAPGNFIPAPVWNEGGILPPPPSQNNDVRFNSRSVSVEPGFIEELRNVANRLEINAEDLLTAMLFETKGTLSPSIPGPHVPGQGRATGLIQFMPSTARGLGTSPDALAKMSQIQQLKFVEAYFRPFTGQIKSLRQLYSTIFTGKLNSSLSASDGYHTLASAIEKMNREHRPKARQILNSNSNNQSRTQAELDALQYNDNPANSGALNRVQQIRRNQGGPEFSSPPPIAQLPTLPNQNQDNFWDADLPPVPKDNPINFQNPNLPPVPKLPTANLDAAANQIRAAEIANQEQEERLQQLESSFLTETTLDRAIKFGRQQEEEARDLNRTIRDASESVTDLTINSKGYLTVQEEINKSATEVSRQYRSQIESLQDQRRNLEYQADGWQKMSENIKKGVAEQIALGQMPADVAEQFLKNADALAERAKAAKEQVVILDQAIEQLGRNQGVATLEASFRKTRDTVRSIRDRMNDLTIQRIRLENQSRPTLFDDSAILAERISLQKEKEELEDYLKTYEGLPQYAEYVANIRSEWEKLAELRLERVALDASPNRGAAESFFSDIREGKGIGSAFSSLGLNIVSKFVEGITKPAIDALTSAIDGFTKPITQAFEWVFNSIIGPVGNFFTNALGSIFKPVGNIFSSIFGRGSGGGLFNGLLSGITGLFGGGLGSLGSTIAPSAFASAPASAFSLGTGFSLFSDGGKVGDANAPIEKNIISAFQRERAMSGGRKPRLIVANEGELVLNPKETEAYLEYRNNAPIKNYANGGFVGGKPNYSTTSNNNNSNQSLVINNTNNVTVESRNDMGYSLTQLKERENAQNERTKKRFFG